MAKKKMSPIPKAKAKKASSAKVAAKKPVKTSSAGKKAAPKKKEVEKKKKGMAPVRSRATTMKRAAPKPAPKKTLKAQRPEPRVTAAMERSPGGRMPRAETVHAGPEAPPPAAGKERDRSRKGGFAQQAHSLAKPNELHPGQTAEHGNTHDRAGSQPERERHLYPNGNRPNSGSARSTQYKGKRRDNNSQGG